MSETAYGLHEYREDGDGCCVLCGFEADDGRAEHVDATTHAAPMTAVETPTLAEFLGQQYDAEEELAREAMSPLYSGGQYGLSLGGVVLADLAVKRRIARLHRETPYGGSGWVANGEYGSFDHACESCGSQDLSVVWPCPTLLALAQPYRDAPGFRDEWKADE